MLCDFIYLIKSKKCGKREKNIKENNVFIVTHLISASEEEEKQTQKHLDKKKKREDLKEANHSSVTTPAETRAKRRNTASGILTKRKKCRDFLNLVVDILYIHGALRHLTLERA